ncbi:hypothetical protein OS493_031130 [Desmophyllum pertusum]|uniref:Uncharacterized protein n=1 Tax=Desmophyllum pertusum TaxID=174260 RepID=A0A9W9YBT6_9CNID|nr:hypothetical protein OS493_031130 [Desmophyllum pertusum]
MASKHTKLDKRIEGVEEKIKSEIQSLKSSVKTMVTEEVKKAKKKIEDDVNESINFIEESLKDKMAEIKEHAIYNEQYSRKSTVRIFGITETDEENVEDKLVQFFNNVLHTEVKSEDIDICHRIGKINPSPNMPTMSQAASARYPTLVINIDTGYDLVEDLTTDIYKRLCDIKKLDSIERCCSIDGKIKYIKKGERAINIIKDGRDVEKLMAGE